MAVLLPALAHVLPSQISTAASGSTCSSTALRASTVAPAMAQQPNNKVLVVDDLPLNRVVLGSLVRKAGFQVEFANNGAEALAQFTAQPPGYFQCILMDLQMPVMDGWQATSALREWEADHQTSAAPGGSSSSAAAQPCAAAAEASWHRTPIVACTAELLGAPSGTISSSAAAAPRAAFSPEVTAKSHALQCGVDECIAKPVSYNDLCNLFERFIPSWHPQASTRLLYPTRPPAAAAAVPTAAVSTPAAPPTLAGTAPAQPAAPSAAVHVSSSSGPQQDQQQQQQQQQQQRQQRPLQRQGTTALSQQEVDMGCAWDASFYTHLVDSADAAGVKERGGGGGRGLCALESSNLELDALVVGHHVDDDEAAAFDDDGDDLFGGVVGDNEEGAQLFHTMLQQQSSSGGGALKPPQQQESTDLVMGVGKGNRQHTVCSSSLAAQDSACTWGGEEEDEEFMSCEEGVVVA